MTTRLRTTTLILSVFFLALPVVRADGPATPPAETKLAGPAGLSLVVRMQGPYDADVPLQVVCYFRRTAASDAKMFGAPVDLDKRLGGVIASLRARGEFAGDDLETLLLDVPAGTIKPKRLLLVGIGDADKLTLATMERVGKVALREAVKLGATRVAFAPLVRDQGNVSLGTGDVETAVTRGMLLAYDTERRLQTEGYAKPFTLTEWVIEAGPTFYDETVAGVKKAIDAAATAVKSRETKPYATLGK